jgi:N-acyl amino acid synthase of PEP-CTERM/exosortase system
MPQDLETSGSEQNQPTTVAPDTAPPIRYFTVQTLDSDARMLEASYRLRYRVYCLERAFLPPEGYPDGMETDQFDRYSVHVGAVDRKGELAGTARVVRVSMEGLPLFRHCQVFHDRTELHRAGNHIVEVSRLSVSRSYNRRQGDDAYGLRGADDGTAGIGSRRPERRHRGGEVIVNVLKGLYQASKRLGATHWLAATERSLQRLLVQYGFCFQLIGPETEYYGRVSPYVMNLAEFDQAILSRQFDALDDFLEGLEPEFCPEAIRL